MKKIFSVLMAIIMLVTGTVLAYAVDGNKARQLKFDENGKFKIMIFADPQNGYPLDEDLIVFMEEALDKTQPDLVVFLGDNVMGSQDKTEESYWLGYDQMLNPLVERGVPFTLVFGNHDDETMPTITKEQMLAKYMSYDGCLAYDADPALHGCGTHNVEILSSDSSKTAFNLWLMDCGDYVFDENGEKLHYDCIRKDQLDWYEQTSKALEEKNGGLVPSMMFQHIVPAEVAEHVMITLPFHIGDLAHFDMEDGKAVTYLPNIFGFYDGMFGEGVSPSTETEGQWDRMVERGDVIATFFGHDHKNTFRADVQGIDAINVPGCTYHAYRSKMRQGAALITLDENDLSNYDYELIFSSQLALEPGSRLPGLSRTKADYAFHNFLRIFLNVLITPFLKISNIFGR